MADSMGPIASAVILPEPEAPKSPRAKRRQSSTSDEISKRPRLSTDRTPDSPSTLRASPQAAEPAKEAQEKSTEDLTTERRKSHVQEERKRGQRLFGGLISTLSQSTSSGQQKRRQEIEKRQQEKAKQQKVEDEGRRAEKLAKLKEVRKVEQVKFDEESMRIRHANMIAMAHFLCTKTEPKLYYLPWELLPRDEDRIKAQIADVEALIEREVEEFKAKHPNQQYQTPPAEKDTNGTSKETVGEPDAEPPSVSNVVDSTNSTHVQASPRSGQASRGSLELNNGEVVVEAEEDTVIY